MRILVLCTGNSCRSQMAEAFLQKMLGDESQVYSAGLKPQQVNKYAIRVMHDIGFDISQNKSNNISEYLEMKFDYVLTVCSHADSLCPAFPGDAKKIHIPFDDPADAIGTEDEILREFARVRDEIKSQMSEWVKTF